MRMALILKQSELMIQKQEVSKTALKNFSGVVRGGTLHRSEWRHKSLIIAADDLRDGVALVRCLLEKLALPAAMAKSYPSLRSRWSQVCSEPVLLVK